MSSLIYLESPDMGYSGSESYEPLTYSEWMVIRQSSIDLLNTIKDSNSKKRFYVYKSPRFNTVVQIDSSRSVLFIVNKLIYYGIL